MRLKYKTSPWNDAGQWIRKVPEGVVIMWVGNKGMPFRIPKRKIKDGSFNFYDLEEVEVIVEKDF